MDGRICTACKTWKSAESFGVRKDVYAQRTGNVLWAKCRECLAEIAAQHRQTKTYKERYAERRQKTPSREGFKVCGHCKQEVPRKMFSKSPASVDLLQSWCRTCSSARKRERYHTDAEYRAQVQALQRASKKKRYRESAEHRAALQREKRSLMGRARQAVHTAVQNKGLSKPDKCQLCGHPGTGREIQGHHHLGYEREHWLDVIWLCIPCHSEAHE